MKKLTLIVATMFMVAFGASAQSLGSLLGSVAQKATGNGTLSDVVRAFTGNLTAVDLSGSWTYQGSALALGSDNALSNIAGAAASGTATNKIDEYLAKVGITEGVMSFTFNEDRTFSCTIKKIPVSGTWTVLEDGKKVQLQFGKNMKYLSMTGTLKSTADGCEMLFESKRFLTFCKSILSFVGKQSDTVGSLSGLVDNYNDMQLGFKLKKVR